MGDMAILIPTLTPILTATMSEIVTIGTLIRGRVTFEADTLPDRKGPLGEGSALLLAT